MRIPTTIRAATCLVAGIAACLLALPLGPAHAHHPENVLQLQSDLGATLSRPGMDNHKSSATAVRRNSLEAGLTDTTEQSASRGDSLDQMLRDLRSRLKVTSRGRRLAPDGTTDVWALRRHAYTGTFDSPCGGTSDDAGVHVWRIREGRRDSRLETVILTPEGSRSNDVKAARMNSGDVLVHSNESCDGGPGGFEIYDVKDPRRPVHLASVRIDEINPITDFLFGGVTDVGVHNLWLFEQGKRDFVGVVAESVFDTFRIYDITNPSTPSLVSAWGAEEAFDPGVGDEVADVNRVLNAALWLLDGFGASANRFLHDITGSPDGNEMYLSNWDAGLILLDISEPSDPLLVSVALDPVNGSLDGEVNSHAAWPSEDGAIVVETEEDFSASKLVFTVAGLGELPALEGSFTTPIASLPSKAMSGPTVFVGLACSGVGGPVPPATSPDQIAVIDGPGCRFDEKATNVIAAGYAGMVVFNILSNGDALLVMGGAPRDIPGIFVGHFSGLAIMGVASAAELVVGAPGANVSAASLPDPWGGVRLWDYSDPANPVLASTFDTTCSADSGNPICDPLGTYSVHNVVVETEGDGDDDEAERRVKAYISWYWDGMLILDVTDPYNPVEIARFSRTDAEFEAQNGGHQDFWGVYKERRRPRIYGSDRNGGLYIFREKEIDDDDDDDDDEGFRLAGN